MGVLSRSDVTVAPPRDLHLSPGMLGTLIRQPVTWSGSSSEQPDEFSAIPGHWNKAQDLTVDDTQARLYLTCTGADCVPPDWSPSHARANS